MEVLVERTILLKHLNRTGGVNVPRDTAENAATVWYLLLLHVLKKHIDVCGLKTMHF